MCGMRRVARPSSTTSSPVAKGSSVPAWPARFAPVARRTTATTSCDVMPAGLSTSASPVTSVVRVSIRWILSILDLGEQRLDPRGPFDAVVGEKHDLGREAEPQRAPDARSQMRRDAGEPLEGRLAIRLRTHHADEHLRVAQVASDLRPCDGYEPRDAWILRVLGEEGRDFLADRFGHAIGAAMVGSHAGTLRESGDQADAEPSSVRATCSLR